MISKAKIHSLLRSEFFWFTVVACIAILVALSPVLTQRGWPQNHEGITFFVRTQVWAQHFIEGDIFPVWSSTDGHGYGTPMPTYYHKLFYSVSAPLLLVTGSNKLAIVIALTIFMLVGAFGMRAAAKLISTNKFIYNAAPFVFIFSNYLFTNWLIRGAMAELSAMAIVPWLLWWCMKLILQKRFSYWVIIIMVALFYAHNAIALVALPIPVLAFFIYLARVYKSEKNKILLFKKPLISGLIFAAAVIPSLVLQHFMNKDYNPADKITQNDFLVSSQFQNPIKYLIDSDYAWMSASSFTDYTVQIAWPLWVACVVLTILFFGVWIRSRVSGKKVNMKPPIAVIFISVLALMYLFLQLPVSGWVYDIVPLIANIQFPWRMLALITPLLILLTVWLLENISAKWFRPKILTSIGTVAAIFWVVLSVAMSPIFVNDTRERSVQYTAPGWMVFYELGEYTPTTFRSDGSEMDMNSLRAAYDKLSQEGVQKGLGECRIVHEYVPYEGLRREYEMSCSQPATIKLPLSYSRYTQLFVDGKRYTFARVKTDPRIQISLPAGKSTIEVKEPTVKTIVEHILDRN